MSQVNNDKYIASVLPCLAGILLLSSCTPVKTPVIHQYTLAIPAHQKTAHKHLPYTLFISKPEAMSGYQTEQMLYVKTPFTLEPFAKNAWINPPASMLYPLLAEHFQNSHGFRAIVSSPFADKTDYRLDTQLITFNQNFLTKKSMFKFTAKIALTRVTDNHVVASTLITKNVPCAKNTPLGGVIAANQASVAFTNDALNFVLMHAQRDATHQNT